MTHGERYVYLKARFDSKKTIAEILIPFSRMSKRMNYKDAAVYYSNKFKFYFEQQLTIKDFDKAEDYFGYYEAIKIRKEILGCKLII